jgi:hypothetical protein
MIDASNSGHVCISTCWHDYLDQSHSCRDKRNVYRLITSEWKGLILWMFSICTPEIIQSTLTAERLSALVILYEVDIVLVCLLLLLLLLFWNGCGLNKRCGLGVVNCVNPLLKSLPTPLSVFSHSILNAWVFHSILLLVRKAANSKIYNNTHFRTTQRWWRVTLTLASAATAINTLAKGLLSPTAINTTY